MYGEKKNAGRRRKDSSKRIWLILIWKYYYSSAEVNYWSELGVLREQAEHHRLPRWARSGQQICHHDHSELMNPWFVRPCSCPLSAADQKCFFIIVGLGFYTQGQEF